MVRASGCRKGMRTVAINRGAAMKWAVLLVMLLACVTSVYAESVPLKREGGTYVVPVLINGRITLDFTLDSGAADVSIPADVFSTMVRTKTVAESDLMGMQVYVLADGSEQNSQRFRIRSLKVGSLELHDVIGSVSPAAGTLLLGQSFLSRIKFWSIDNVRHVFVFNETTPRAAADVAAKRPSVTVGAGPGPLTTLVPYVNPVLSNDPMMRQWGMAVQARKDNYADFDSVVNPNNFTGKMLYCMALRLAAADISYYLATHQDEAAQIARLPESEVCPAIDRVQNAAFASSR